VRTAAATPPELTRRQGVSSSWAVAIDHCRTATNTTSEYALPASGQSGGVPFVASL